jgi:hypothetical protein
MNESDQHRLVFNNYIHSAVTPPYYEQFCILRFISLAHFAKSAPRGSSFIHYDLDIVALGNMFDSIDVRYWYMGSYLASWSMDLLSDYTSFVTSFYSETNRTYQSQLITRYGEPLRGVYPSEAVARDRIIRHTRGWWIGDPDDIRNWNDMFMLQAFVGERRPVGFLQIYGYACEKRINGISERYVVRHYHEFVPHILQLMNQTTFAWNEVAGTTIRCYERPISSLHFQGSSKRLLCPSMCRLIANSFLIPCCAAV